MVKVKELWHHLCEELNYRFFAGVPHIGLKLLYDSMDPKIMHYVPAVKENIALGLVSGAYLAEVRGGMLIHVDRFDNILETLRSFNLKHNVPVLIFVYDDNDNTQFFDTLSLYKIPYVFLKDGFKKLDSLIVKMEKTFTPGVVIIRKGTLKK